MRLAECEGRFHLEAVGGAFGPEERLANGEGVGKVGGNRLCVELAPEVDVLGAVVGATGEEQRGARAGKLSEVIGVGHVAPLLRVQDEGVEVRGDNAHARAVLEVVVPEEIEG